MLQQVLVHHVAVEHLSLTSHSLTLLPVLTTLFHPFLAQCKRLLLSPEVDFLTVLLTTLLADQQLHLTAARFRIVHASLVDMTRLLLELPLYLLGSAVHLDQYAFRLRQELLHPRYRLRVFRHEILECPLPRLCQLFHEVGLLFLLAPVALVGSPEETETTGTDGFLSQVVQFVYCFLFVQDGFREESGRFIQLH